MSSLIDYILIDKYKHIKTLLYLLRFVNIGSLIAFNYKYGYTVLNYLAKNKLTNLIQYNLRNHIFNNLSVVHRLDLVYSKYGNNQHVTFFIEILGTNIHKVTKYNIDNIFQMFLLTHIEKFQEFNSWGRGNNKNIKTNIENHYQKHRNEDWQQHIPDFNLQSYKQFAIEKSRYMEHKLIHTNGTKVYLSGIYQNVLIIGRLQKNNQLGISSCYIIDNMDEKLKGFNNNICFEF